MNEIWVDILITRDRRRAAELALVLDSRAIANATASDRDEFRLSVRHEDMTEALRQLRDYERENSRSVGGPRHIGSVDSGWGGVVVYATLLAVFAIAAQQELWGYDWLAAGQADGRAMPGGQWWRAITALCLHVDFVHLIGNVGFGSLFGLFVGRYLGSGVGWLAVVAAGALGNWVNALLQQPDYRAIGASTAVFAALGLLSSYTWRRGFLRGTPWRVRFTPITAGIALLAFTGTAGENTDLGAHLFGFAMGFGAGMLLAQLPRVPRPRIQAVCAALAIGLVTLAWVLALVSTLA
jgi:rhomboid protease GluP